MSASWHEGPVASYDCETTGVDPESDRIVSAALIQPDGSVVKWLAAVEVDIPAEAENVHKISTEHARKYGAPPAFVVGEIATALAKHLADGAPLVVMNAPFDLTMLDRECSRYGVPTVADRIGRPVGPVVDPLAMDRAVDKWRKGSRSLETLAKVYGVPLVGAHEAEADAQAALGVALAIAKKHRAVRLDAETLHRAEAIWYRQWAAGYEAHKRKTDPTVVIDGSWPVRPAVTS